MKFDVNKEVGSPLGFKPDEKLNNLCLGELLSVEVEKNLAPKEKENGEISRYDYAGFELPSLVFKFKQLKVTEDRFFQHRESVIISTMNDGTPMNPKTLSNLYESMWDRIKHLMDTFVASANYKAIKKLPEINENATPEERVAQFTAFFTAIADFFNHGTDGLPIYKNEKGNIPLMMKLVANYPDRKYLAFPTFVGKRFIEVAKFKENKLVTVLELGPKETVTLARSADKQPVPGVESNDSKPKMEAISDDIMDLINV